MYSQSSYNNSYARQKTINTIYQELQHKCGHAYPLYQLRWETELLYWNRDERPMGIPWAHGSSPEAQTIDSQGVQLNEAPPGAPIAPTLSLPSTQPMPSSPGHRPQPYAHATMSNLHGPHTPRASNSDANNATNDRQVPRTLYPRGQFIDHVQATNTLQTVKDTPPPQMVTHRRAKRQASPTRSNNSERSAKRQQYSTMLPPSDPSDTSYAPSAQPTNAHADIKASQLNEMQAEINALKEWKLQVELRERDTEIARQSQSGMIPTPTSAIPSIPPISIPTLSSPSPGNAYLARMLLSPTPRAIAWGQYLLNSALAPLGRWGNRPLPQPPAITTQTAPCHKMYKHQEELALSRISSYLRLVKVLKLRKPLPYVDAQTRESLSSPNAFSYLDHSTNHRTC